MAVSPSRLVRTIAYRILRLPCFYGVTLLLYARVWGTRNVPKRGRLIVAANHQSYLDPFLVGAVTPRVLHYMARDTLFRSWLFARLIRFFNAFPVRRGGADVTAFKHSLRMLQQGRVVLVFPESTRTTTGRIKAPHPGVIALARRAGAPILPVALEGPYEIWPRTRKLPRRAPLWVEFGQLIDVTAFTDRADAVAARILGDALRDLHNRVRGRAGRQPFLYPIHEEMAPAAAQPKPPTKENHMAEPIHGSKPMVIEETAGKKAYCQCGRSAKLPYCDGAHAREQTGLAPVVCDITEDGRVAVCQCHKSGNLPFCDGTHSKT